MFVWLILALVIIYYYLKFKFEYWKRKNVPGPEPTYFVGNIGPTFLKKKSMGEIVAEIYRNYENLPVVGIYKAGTPCLIAKDPDLIRDVTVKHFKSFEDNDLGVPMNSNPLFGRNPFVMRGEQWKKGRAHLTPSFTNLKMKSYFPLINEISKEFVEYINRKIDAGYNILDCKMEMGNFTLENVANCALGLKANTLTDKESPFKYIAENFISPGLDELKIAFTYVFPSFYNFFGIRVFNKIIEDRIQDIVDEALKYRQESGEERADFLQQLQQVRSKDPSYTNVDMAAAMSAFLVDGYDTSANVFTYILYELSLHQHVQETLRKEVLDYFEECDGKVTFDGMQDLKYLEAVIYETLRLHPILSVLGKICNERFHYETSNPLFKKMALTIEPGEVILIPYTALHTDSKYFANPNEFYPDRFTNEPKWDPPKYVFMPFGEGPRTCLGQRFGLIQLKIGLMNLVKNFRFTLHKDTEVPMKVEPWSLVMVPNSKIGVKFEKN